MVVGAYQDDDNGSDSGSAYLFAMPATGWATATETAKLTASDGAADDYFGYSVAVEGQTVVVGAYQDDDKGASSGSAYAYYSVPAWTAVPDSGPGATNATSYTVTGLANGAEYDFRIRAVNAFGKGAASEIVTATLPNTAPTAVDDTASTDEDTAVDINVTANDTDPDSGTTLSVTAVTTPPNGTAAIAEGSATTVTYTPNAGYNGTDSFDYTLFDGTDTDTGTVTVFVGPPVKPTGLAATAGYARAALTWDDPSNSTITGYEYLQAQAAKLTASDGALGDNFGRSVSVDGDTMVVGANKDDDNALNSGSAYVYIRQSGAWSQVAKLTAFDGASEDGFGFSVSVDGDTVVVGAYLEDDNGAASGSAYVFTKLPTGWTTTSTAAKLTASDGAADDYFGFSVAVEGETVVVGAYQDDDDGPNSGSAYVFTKPAGGWTTTSTAAKLTASDGATGDNFGISVAVNGDTVVVGAWWDDGERGSAYVFTKPATGWTTTSTAAKLTAFERAADDYFGRSAAVDGDTVVVGAPRDDDKGEDSGSAYLFAKPAAGWATATETAKLTASDAAADDEFGFSVAVDGDTVVVGALYDDDNGEDSGSAYLFAKPGTGWATATETVKLAASDGASDDWFGRSVAVDGDTVVVGAHQEDDNGSNSGSAYVYEVSDWTAVPNSGPGETNATSYTVTGLTNGAEYDVRIRAVNAFGKGAASDAVTVTPINTAPSAVDDTAITAEDTVVDINVAANDTDTDGDTLSVTSVATPSNGTAMIAEGSTTTVTYTPNANFNGSDSFDYTLSDGTGTDIGAVTVTVTAVSDAPVAVDDTAVTAEDTAVDINVTANDTDPDSGATLSVTSVTTPSNGTAVITSGSTTTVTYTPNAGYNGTDSFDYTLSDGTGTGTDTGTATVTVGTPRKPTGLTATSGNTQAALTWDDPSDSGITGYDYLLHRELAKLTPIDGAAGDNFGWSVAVDGDTAVVSTYRDNNVKGAVYVLTRQSGTWSVVAKLTASDGDAGDHFGYSVAMDGDTVLVGATANDGNSSGSGAAYLFVKPNGGWVTATQTAKLTAYDGATSDSFGHAVAMDGDTVVVGAYRDDDNGLGSGSAYVFTKPSDGWADATETAKLTASDGAAGEYFGLPVAVSGDTVVVSARGDINDRGAVYVFTKPSDGWATTTGTVKLTAFDGADDDDFGISVAVDGVSVVVGAWYDDDNGFNSGSVYVFTEPSSGGWTTTTEAAKLTASDGAANDQFGVSVAVDGEKLVVGAYRTDSFKGSAYVFTKPGNGWATATETAKLNASDRAASDNFGLSVAVDGDTVVVGSPYDDDNGAGSGSVYVYEVSDWTAVPGSGASDTNATSYTVTGLTNDAEYDFRIRATNNAGTGPTSDAVHVTPANTAPTAADDTATTAVSSSVDINVVANDTDPDSGDTLSVTAVTTPSNGTAAIASGNTTTVTYTPDADFTGTDSFDYTLSDGTDTDTGTVTVTVGPAGNVSGQGGTPVEPTGLVATPGDDQLALAWDDPGNSNITKYQYSTDGGTTFTDIPGSSATTISYTVTGLSSGTEYTIAVRAVNANGNGAAATVTATTFWPAPENLVAAADSTRVVLQWDTGDAGITNYLVRSHAEGSGGDPAEKVVAPGSGTRTTTEVTGLTNGTAYVFSVRAAEVSGGETVVTGVGATVTETPAVAVPAVPANLTATPGDGQVAVTWDDPGNITIRKYQYSTDGGSSFNHMNASNRDTTSFTFNNLTNGTEYTLAIRASNLSGESTAATETVTAGWPAPTNVVATPSNQRVKLEWDTGDPGIANYVIRSEVTGSGNYFYTILAAGNGATTSYTNRNLNNGTEYTSTVGAGEFDSNNFPTFTGQTVTVTATPLGPAPTGLLAARDSTRVVLRWDTGGSEVTNYLVRTEITGGNGDPEEKVVAPWSGSRTITAVTSLTDGTEYTFSVMAAEVSGTETVVAGIAASVTETPGVAVPAAPTGLTATPGGGQVAVTWDNPGNITIRKYQYSTDGGTTFNHMNGSNRNTTSHTITGLTNGTEYTLAIRASNLSGDSTAATVTATAGLPAPENLVAAPDSTRVVLQWDTGGSGVTNYLVRSQAEGSGGDPAEKVVAPGSGTRTTTEVTGLTNGTAYVFSVRAAEVSGGETVVTGVGATVTETPTVAVPATPANLTATPGDGQVAVTWGNPGNITIRKYQYSTDGGTTFNHMNGSGRNTTSFTFNNLTSGTEYTLAIRASNLSGESTAATVTATAAWPAPTNVVATPSNHKVKLEWDTGDPGIANYVVRLEVTGSGNYFYTILAAGNGATTSYTNANLTNGTEYTLTVGAGELDSTNTAAFIGQTVTVTATPSS